MLNHKVELTPEQEAILRNIRCEHGLYAEMGCPNAIYCDVTAHGVHVEDWVCMAKQKGLPCNYEVITIGKSNIRDTVAGSSP